MANEFDPYREALVVEKIYHWSADSLPVSPELREAVESELDRRPGLATHLTYVRLATGFRREITITKEDVDRIRSTSGNTDSIMSAGRSVHALANEHSLPRPNDATTH